MTKLLANKQVHSINVKNYLVHRHFTGVKADVDKVELILFLG